MLFSLRGQIFACQDSVSFAQLAAPGCKKKESYSGSCYTSSSKILLHSYVCEVAWGYKIWWNFFIRIAAIQEKPVTFFAHCLPVTSATRVSIEELWSRLIMGVLGRETECLLMLLALLTVVDSWPYSAAHLSLPISDFTIVRKEDLWCITQFCLGTGPETSHLVSNGKTRQDSARFSKSWQELELNQLSLQKHENVLVSFSVLTFTWAWQLGDLLWVRFEIEYRRSSLETRPTISHSAYAGYLFMLTRQEYSAYFSIFLAYWDSNQTGSETPTSGEACRLMSLGSMVTQFLMPLCDFEVPVCVLPE